MTNDAEVHEMVALAALDELYLGLGGAEGDAVFDLERLDINPADLCREYHKWRPEIEKALVLVEAIPVYGKKIAQVIRYLMMLADFICKTLV